MSVEVVRDYLIRGEIVPRYTDSMMYSDRSRIVRR